jgi:ABC-type lipoprotein release transport system permease subunit
MRLVVRLAWRSLWRNRRRSALTAAAVTVAVFLMTIMWGWTGAVERNLFENVTELETGHLRVRPAGGGRLDGAMLKDAGAVLDILSRHRDLRLATLRLDLPALAATGDRARGVLVRGVLADRERALADYGRWVVEGRDLRDNETDAALAGDTLLDHLRLHIGDEITLLVSGRRTGVTARTARIAGRLALPSPELRQTLVLVPLSLAQQLAGAPGEASTAVGLIRGVHRASDQGRIRTVARSLQTQLGPAHRVETWDIAAPDLTAYLGVVPVFMVIFGGIVVLLGGMVVGNTCYLGVLERTRELGVLAALGTGSRRLTGLILVEAALLCIPATAAGVGAAWWLIARLSTGFTVKPLADVHTALGLRPLFFAYLAPGRAAATVLLMVGIALVTAALPARIAGAMPPAEAMRPR